MEQDVRDLLIEVEREESQRWFKDMHIGDWFVLSIQASPVHSSEPVGILDPKEYDSFEVGLRTIRGVICSGAWDAWEELQHKPWAKYFDHETGALLIGEFVPVAEVQQIYEDLQTYARTHPSPM